MVENPYENFLEIDEIREIFKLWNKTNDNLSNQQIIDIISYFFPDVCIENDKHIHEFNCPLWNKGTQMELSVENYEKWYINYALDGDKMKVMGWVPKKSVKERISEVVNWTIKNKRWIEL